jgi:hypothetical protein
VIDQHRWATGLVATMPVTKAEALRNGRIGRRSFLSLTKTLKRPSASDLRGLKHRASLQPVARWV